MKKKIEENQELRKMFILYGVIFLFCIYIFFMFLWNGLDQAPIVRGKQQLSSFSLSMWKLFFYPHLILGLISLLIGPFQLTNYSRKNLKLHKYLGRIYAISIFINTLCTPYLSFFATGGKPSMYAFLILDIFWFFTTSIGVIFAVKGRINQHKAWMIRSFAITWVFVTFRIVVIPLSLIFETQISFPIAVYLSIILNFSVVELLRRKKLKRLNLSFEKGSEENVNNISNLRK